MTTPSFTILDKGIECFTSARRKIAEGAAILHKVSTEKLWEASYSSLAEYLDDCQISQGYASKLIKAYEHYVIQGGLSPRKFEEVDSEKAYLAIGLPGSPEKQLTQALTLSRQELRDELAEDENGEDCKHKNHGDVCFDCHKRLA